MLMLRQKNEQDEAHIFQYIYFKSSQIHQLTAMYHFEHISLHNCLNVLF